jgi:tetratricopeptide (TPR) repeat protein
LATVLFILALLSKPAAMTLPMLAIAIDWLLVGRALKQALYTAASWIVLAAPIAVLARLIQTIPSFHPIAPLWLRPFIAGDALVFYIAKIVWPVHLAIDYGRRWWIVSKQPWFYVSLLIMIVIAGVLIRLRRKFPWLLAALIVFLGSLLPVSGLTAFEFQYTSTTADHYLYVAMLGPAMIVAFILARPMRAPARVAASIVLILLAILTIRQQRVWQNDLTLFSHALRVNPQSPVVHTNLGNAYWMRNDIPDAIAEYRRSIQVDPEYVVAYGNLEQRLLDVGDLDGAIDVMRKLIEIKSHRSPRDDEQDRRELSRLLEIKNQTAATKPAE